jgi:hypothetical protein
MQHWLPKRWTARCRTEKVFWYTNVLYQMYKDSIFAWAWSPIFGTSTTRIAGRRSTSARLSAISNNLRKLYHNKMSQMAETAVVWDRRGRR